MTRLGRGVDTSGQLAAEAIEDVCDTVGEYIAIYEPLEPDVVTAIATSAVRDAENSGAFLAELRERFALEARILDGAEEARLTYLGASAEPLAASTAPWWSTSAAARRSSSSARDRRSASTPRFRRAPFATRSAT